MYILLFLFWVPWILICTSSSSSSFSFSFSVISDSWTLYTATIHFSFAFHLYCVCSLILSQKSYLVVGSPDLHPQSIVRPIITIIIMPLIMVLHFKDVSYNFAPGWGGGKVCAHMVYSVQCWLEICWDQSAIALLTSYLMLDTWVW